MAKKKFTAIMTVHIRAAADTQEEAWDLRNERLNAVNNLVQAGGDPTRVPGALVEGWDPGDGPCAAFREAKMPVNQSGLPEAQSRRDD